MGQPLEHGLKSAYLGMRMADHLGITDDEREAVFFGALIKDSG